jgi:hypothetical protein
MKPLTKFFKALSVDVARRHDIDRAISSLFVSAFEIRWPQPEAAMFLPNTAEAERVVAVERLGRGERGRMGA